MHNLKQQMPLWIGNAIVFLLLFVAVCTYFSWQIHEVENSVLLHAQQYADVVSKIISLNARGTIAAQQSIENILQNLLGNSARFVAYLDMIEPFSSDELRAFTRESGLAGITVMRHESGADRGSKTDQSVSNTSKTKKEHSVNGPEGWLPQGFTLTEKACSPEPVMIHLSKSHLYLLLWREPDYPDCIALGIKDDKIAAITEGLGLNNIIKAISTVPGIRGIEIHNLKGNGSEEQSPDGNSPGRRESQMGLKLNLKTIAHGEESSDQSEADQYRQEGAKHTSPAIIHKGGLDIAQASQIVQGMEIIVGVDASHLAQSIRQLTMHFYLFSFFLTMAGIVLSFVLHRYQTSVLNRVKQFERELAAQRENATLGKSAAAIAHEIRNPLNALSMGLQRLQLENGSLSQMHMTLIHQMSEAVKRANGSVTGLLNYARPRIPKIKPFVLEDLLADILNLYQKRCSIQGIDINVEVKYCDKVESDPELMGQVIENIIKNAVEAQPDGGFIHISITDTSDERHIRVPADNYLTIVFKNSSCPIDPDSAHKILEPYFTTRPEGTGLGMAIVRNIIKTLDGEIKIEITESRDISTTLYLPIKEMRNADSHC